jgi:SAM-dependent methyltransferase
MPASPTPAVADEMDRDCWNNAAQSWTTFVQGGLDLHRMFVHGPALLQACGEVGGLRVLDIGCGEGWCCRELARRGARVVGVDISDLMIARAGSYSTDEPSRIEYRIMDAAHVQCGDWNCKFDLVTACMSLHAMRDPGAVLRAARRVLTEGGRLVCSVPHPFTHAQNDRQSKRCQVDGQLWLQAGGYFDEAKEHHVRWNVPRVGATWTTIRWSRSLEAYWRLFANSGFVVRDLREPFPDGDVATRLPSRNSADVPEYLIFAAQTEPC